MQTYEGKVVIATHFYKHQTCLEYAHSLAATVVILERLGIKYDYWPISGHFHMENCVNDTLTRFMNSDATDIIMIDSDESWNPQHLVRLLLHEEDIVCGVYLQCSVAQRKYPVVLKTADDGSHLGKMLPDGNCLLEAKRVPGGFLKISKRALQAWADKNPDEWFWLEDRKTYKFFVNEFRDHIFYGMDFCFSDKMRDAGFQLWVDPICDVRHWGVMEFYGTLDSYLRTEKKNQEAFATVAQMAKEIEERNG